MENSRPKQERRNYFKSPHNRAHIHNTQSPHGQKRSPNTQFMLNGIYSQTHVILMSKVQRCKKQTVHNSFTKRSLTT